MPRVRSLHAEQATDEDVCSLSIYARYTWALLPTHADRLGRMLDRPFTLKLAILPTDNVDMEAILSELAAEKPGYKPFIKRYVGSDGRRYIQIRSFLDWQTPHKNEARSEIPGPPPEAPGNPPATSQPSSDISGNYREGPVITDQEENRELSNMSVGSQKLPGTSGEYTPLPDPDPVPGPNTETEGARAPACDPTATTTEHGVDAESSTTRRLTDFTCYDLECLMRKIQVTQRPDLGAAWNPGKWAAKSFDAFIGRIPSAADRIALVPEVKRRAERFFRAKDEKTFTIERFLEQWNALAGPPAKPGAPPKQAGGYPYL